MEVVRFYRAMHDGIPPMRADLSALGGIPAAAFQYCEATRIASSLGWYVFPAENIRLRWDGSDVEIETDGEWGPLYNEVDPDFADSWNKFAPADLQDCAPPYISKIFVPGVIQVWSGYFMETMEGWSSLVRPVVNVPRSHAYSCYEGVVETDWFNPCPLFVNIKLIETNKVIEIPANQPLFQLQMVKKESYNAGQKSEVIDLNEIGESAATERVWSGIRNTLRSISTERPSNIGRYAAEARKRNRQRTVESADAKAESTVSASENTEAALAETVELE